MALYFTYAVESSDYRSYLLINDNQMQKYSIETSNFAIVESNRVDENVSPHKNDFEEFSEKFNIRVSNPRFYLSGNKYFLSLNEVAHTVRNFTDRYINTNDLLSDDFRLDGDLIGSVLDRDTVHFYSKRYDFIVYASNLLNDLTIKGYMEHRENSYVFYLPMRYNANTKMIDYTFFVLMKKDIRQNTNCCLLACFEPDKYKYIGE